MRKSACLLALTALLALSAPAHSRRASVLAFDFLARDFILPEALIKASGHKLTDPADWPARRDQILELYRDQVYGRSPGKPSYLSFELIETGPALDGRAVRKQTRVFFKTRGSEPYMDLLVYTPQNAGGPVPCFLILNFKGNHTVAPDPAILVTSHWVKDSGSRINKHKARVESRGQKADRYPLDTIIGRGYGLATAYYGDIDPDFDDGFKNGVHGAFDAELGYDGSGARPADLWGSIGAWSWGLSRALDCLEQDSAVDAERVAVFGHSRLGKAALWAGAQDERFAMVISNDSGCGGAALFRRQFGETAFLINAHFPHWFCDNFKAYNFREDKLPVDQHMLLALVAPRPVYVASAEEDWWSDPRGEFLALAAASPVYELVAGRGLAVNRMPEVGERVTGLMGYHVRAGGHDLTSVDWDMYLDFADHNLKPGRKSSGQ